MEYGWQQVDQAENVERIAADATELHDRLAVFVDHFTKVGGGLATAINAYNNAVGSMQSRVLPQATKMREHGVRTGRTMGEPQPIDTEPRALGAK